MKDKLKAGLIDNGGTFVKEIPRQYKYNSDTIIYNIGKLADKLYPIMTELGNNVEIKSDKCLVIIKKLKEDKE